VDVTAAQVKARARELGFDLCGIARAHPLAPERLDRWLSQGWDAGLEYVRARREERLDPSRLLPGARSVIVVAASYAPAPGDPEPAPGELAVARYARGRDYHNVVLKPVRKLAAWLRQRGAAVYAEVDAGAVMEKAWAAEAGLGWIGKNGCLINERLGSWLLLGALIADAGLESDVPHPDRCGECALCIPACPTDAIPEPRYVDARRCIAYHTIEHRDPIPEDIAARAGARIFGCDACQDVCPWNRRAPAATLVPLRARTPSLRAADVLSLTKDETRRRFEGTPLLRAGRDGLVRTALAIGAVPLAEAEKLADDAAPGVREQARRRIRALQREGKVSTAPFTAPASGETR
jgi:epoxyqueuosine reductase